MVLHVIELYLIVLYAIHNGIACYFIVLHGIVLHGVVQFIQRAGELPRSASSHFVLRLKGQHTNTIRNKNQKNSDCETSLLVWRGKAKWPKQLLENPENQNAYDADDYIVDADDVDADGVYAGDDEAVQFTRGLKTSSFNMFDEYL